MADQLTDEERSLSNHLRATKYRFGSLDLASLISWRPLGDFFDLTFNVRDFKLLLPQRMEVSTLATSLRSIGTLKERE